MEGGAEEKLIKDLDSYSETKLNDEFYEFLKLTEEEEESEEEEEFSFMSGGENTSPIAAEDAFNDGQIKTVFPLFNRSLLFPGGDPDSLNESLPMRPPVKKVFVETNEENYRVTSSTSGTDEIVGPYCDWSSRKAVEASPEACKKSNSTGFSKIWRFKEFRERCNSDGRDAFVFLNSSHAPSAAKKQTTSVAAAEEKRETALKVERKVRKSGKSKTASAHEVYLRSKAKEDERRRSYLPYRPELMGFFTNVNSGLTKNVHPF